MRREIRHLILEAEKTLSVDELVLERLEGISDLSPLEVRALHVLRHLIYDRDLLETDISAQDHQREILRSLRTLPSRRYSEGENATDRTDDDATESESTKPDSPPSMPGRTSTARCALLKQIRRTQRRSAR